MMDINNLYDEQQVLKMLIEFALIYSRATNRDIANDAAEYLSDNEIYRITTQWHPMEEAPKDGSILIATGFGDTVQGFYDSPAGWWATMDECKIINPIAWTHLPIYKEKNMENNKQYLKLKKEIDLINGQNSYSICLRGARTEFKNNSNPLLIYIGNSFDLAYKAEVLLVRHIKFNDLNKSDFEDNYNIDARSFVGIRNAMLDIYPFFEDREIVTIIKFMII